MSGRDNSQSPLEFMHVPVMLAECIEGLGIKSGGTYIDGTLGGGGHSEAILKASEPDGKLYGIDRDDSSIAAAGTKLLQYADRFTAIKGNFFDMVNLLQSYGVTCANGVLLDLGVSSHQLDETERGFSYQRNAPLDMRMDRLNSFSAYDVVNSYEEIKLKRVIQEYGEERWAARIAKFIVKARKEKPIEDTMELVDIIKAAIPASARKDGPHPAKRTFQAIRIEVNSELDGLGEAIESICGILAPGGRLCVITFHSLEDRIVKQTFRRLEQPCDCPPDLPVCTCNKRSLGFCFKKVITPTEKELERNPRSRSAKLRVFERTARSKEAKG